MKNTIGNCCAKNALLVREKKIYRLCTVQGGGDSPKQSFVNLNINSGEMGNRLVYFRFGATYCTDRYISRPHGEMHNRTCTQNAIDKKSKITEKIFFFVFLPRRLRAVDYSSLLILRARNY